MKLSKKEQHITVYKLSTLMPILLKPSDELKNIISILPKPYNYETYEEVIKHFGAYFVIRATTEGKGFAETSLSTRFYYEKGEEHTKASAKIEFSFLKVNVEASRGLQSELKEYVSQSTISSKVIGGDSALFKLNEFDKWKSTVRKAPIPITYEVAPIWSIITDRTIADNFKRATTEYLKKNQRNEPSIISNCNHVVKAYDAPAGTIKSYSVLDDNEMEEKYHIVRGKSPDNRCIVSLSYLKKLGRCIFGNCPLPPLSEKIIGIGTPIDIYTIGIGGIAYVTQPAYV
jgi:hypothetical protein